MVIPKLRDRDAIVTEQGLIFRVFGYSHPTNAYLCDVEYASAEIFKSDDKRALRSQGQHVFYKFYEDEGWKFIHKNFPQYIIFHDMLQRQVIGIHQRNSVHVRKPEQQLTKLLRFPPKDKLVRAAQDALGLVIQQSDLSKRDFGIFGSLLHGFHHPMFSDIDLVVYGRKNLTSLHESLGQLYTDGSTPLENEFEKTDSVVRKRWKFQNYSLKEYSWHQRRKMIYALFNDKRSGRIIKVEFEPVKGWAEIESDYDKEKRIMQEGWTRMAARVVEDSDAPFIPSVYDIEPLEIFSGPEPAIDATRIVSYVEEFRMQVRKDEVIYVEGNLERVTDPKKSFYQVALTYCPRYYEQVLKTST